MNQSALLSVVGLLCTVGRNFSCVAWSRPAFNPASHHLLQQFSQRCDFEHINFEVRWRQGAVEQKGRIPDSGCGRAPKGSTAPLFAGRCRWWGRLERRYAILFLSTAARTGSRPGPQLGFCGWEGCCRCYGRASTARCPFVRRLAHALSHIIPLCLAHLSPQNTHQVNS